MKYSSECLNILNLIFFKYGKYVKQNIILIYYNDLIFHIWLSNIIIK